VYVKYYTSAVRPYPRISYNTGRVACEVVVWGIRVRATLSPVRGVVLV